MIYDLSSILAVIISSKTIFGLENCFLQEKYIISNLVWSKIIPFWVA